MLFSSAKFYQGNTWQYWRLNVLTNNGSQYLGVGYSNTTSPGFILTSAPGGSTLLTSNMAYSQSSLYNSSDTFAYCCTSSSSSAVWLTDGTAGPWWAQVNCLTPMAFQEMRFCSQNDATGPSRAPNTFNISVSSDGVHFRVLKQWSGVNNWAQNQYKTFSLT
jgi:hypothetical protein